MAMPIRRLDQVKALANPLRLHILEAMAEEARTPKQVADLLRLKPTGLYHHVRVLEAAGLIRQTKTRKKRGTVERYYRAASGEVRVDPGVFARRRSPGPSAALAAVLDGAQADVQRLGPAVAPMIALRLRTRVSPARLNELEGVLRKWAASAGGAGAADYSLTLVAYPRPNVEKARRAST